MRKLLCKHICKHTSRLTEKLRQKIVKIFKDNNLGITSTANLTQVQFLDVTLDLKKESYKPFIKPGDKPTYVHSQSNHPPRIIKNIPLSIIKRLAKISANKAASPLYQAELTKSGYQHTLEFDQTATTNRRRTRTRKVIYFNPPYSIYNRLPASIRLEKKMPSFKKSLKMWVELHVNI